MHFIRILCIAALGTPALSGAQAGPIPAWPVAPGSRVRVLSPVFGDQKQAGRVVSTTSDTLVFLPAKQSTSIAIGTPYIFAMDVANGTHTQKLTDALVGLLIGAGGGAIIGYATYKRPKPCEFCIDFGPGAQAIAVGALGAIGGAVVGTTFGSRQTDTWVPVAVPAR
jgi:hypothetical protein